MSSVAIKWARAQNVGSAALKSVVMTIAVRADKKGATWASQASLAADAGMGERTIRRHLALLEALGIITRIVRSKGRQGRLTDQLTLSLHRKFDLTAWDIRDARNRLQNKVPTGQPCPVEAESSNRPLLVLPTGQRWPGNKKGNNISKPRGKATDIGGDQREPTRPRLAVVNGGYWYDDQEVPF